MSLNKAILIGRTGKDPEVRYIGDEGKSKVARFSLATDEHYRDKSGNTRVATVWHTIVAWNAVADYVEKYIGKGTLLYVEGPIRYSTWTDGGGIRRSSCEIAAADIRILGRKEEVQKPEKEQDGGKSPEGKDEYEFPDDGLPF